MTDPFRDDYSEDEEVIRRKAYIPLRPKVISKINTARYSRARSPEMVPDRFTARPGPALVEPFVNVLSQKTLTLRLCELECGWKGCNAILGSEALLKKHVEIREHAKQGECPPVVSGTRRCLAMGDRPG